MSTWYRQGTISVTNGSATVVGIGTAWGAANSHSGDVLLAPDGKLYEILSVDSVTQLTIKPTFSNQTGYQGTTDTSGTAKYAIAPLVGSTTTADLAQRISALLTQWQDRQDELSNWQGGTVTGGDGTGRYPLTDSFGNTVNVLCPSAVLNIVDNLDTELQAAETFASAAQTSATSAQTYASQASSSAGSAATSASSASTSATSASNSASSASASAATATTKATAANTSATAAASSASSATTAANSATASATSAANSATAAAASAEEAANIVTSGMPTASTTQLGGVKIDGSTITINNGVISSPNQDLSGYSLTTHNHAGVYEPVITTLPVSKGGTGSSTQNFVDLTSNQAIGGVKKFSSNLLIGTTTDDGVNKLQVNGRIATYQTGDNGVTIYGGGGNSIRANYNWVGTDAAGNPSSGYLGSNVWGSDGSTELMGNTLPVHIGIGGTRYVTVSSTGLSVTGTISATALPTSDPHVAGAFWRSGNTVMVSTG